MGSFNDALQDALDAVANDANREEGQAPAPTRESERISTLEEKAPPTPIVVSRPPVEHRVIVMTPSPADDHNARWRTLMRQEDHPNIELMRERRNRNQCPICSTQAPKIGRSAVPQLHYCESCSFPFHVYVS